MTPALEYNVSASNLQSALEAFLGLGRVYVTQTGDGYASSAFGFSWRILFEVVTSDLQSFQVIPGADWKGVGATIHVQLPAGRARWNWVIGNTPEVRLVAVCA